MWLRAARNRFLIRTLATVLALIVGGAAFDWGHAGNDDPDCNVVIVHHDHSAHRFSAAPTSPSPASDHCYICHSLRSLHGALTAASGRTPIDIGSATYRSHEMLLARGIMRSALGSRAPPAIHL